MVNVVAHTLQEAVNITQCSPVRNKFTVSQNTVKLDDRPHTTSVRRRSQPRPRSLAEQGPTADFVNVNMIDSSLNNEETTTATYAYNMALIHQA